MKSTYSLPDPLGIRETTASVFKNSKFVSVDYEKLKIFAKEIKKRIDRKELLDEWQFGKIKKSPQGIFILDTVNFCFWAKKGERKWKVEYPKGNILDGWKALVACFDRALEEHMKEFDIKIAKDYEKTAIHKIAIDDNNIEYKNYKYKSGKPQEFNLLFSLKV